MNTVAKTQPLDKTVSHAFGKDCYLVGRDVDDDRAIPDEWGRLNLPNKDLEPTMTTELFTLLQSIEAFSQDSLEQQSRNLDANWKAIDKIAAKLRARQKDNLMPTTKCAHPDCQCLDYCENQDPHSKGYDLKDKRDEYIQDQGSTMKLTAPFRQGETKIDHSDHFDMDVWLFSNPHPVSFLVRSASYEDCEACEQDPYIEIPLDQLQEFIDLLKGIEYQLTAIQDSKDI